MVSIGVNHEGSPHIPTKRVDSGYVVPNVSISELHQRHRQRVDNQVQTAVEIEDLGYDYLVRAEHHCSILGGVSSNPVTTQTAIARETDSIRLLQMANILPLHEPVRLAEQLALLDVHSDGRLEVGVAPGFSSSEKEILGQYWGASTGNETKDFASFEEKYDLLLKSWTENFVSHHGTFHDVPPEYVEYNNFQDYYYLKDDVSEHDVDDFLQVAGETTTLKSVPVVPQPAQDPHPQLWKPALSQLSVEWAAKRGLNVCTHIDNFENVSRRIDIYHEAAKQAGWPDHREEYDGEPFNRGWDADRGRGFAAIISLFNTEVANEDTVERWRRGFEYSLSQKKGKSKPEEALQIDIDVDERLDEYSVPIVGDTEHIIDRLAEFKETCGYDDFILFIDVESVGLSYEERRKQLRAFARDVVPHFENS